MSIIDTALRADLDYAKKYDPKLGAPPAPKIAVVTCMDPRLSDLPEILGLARADIDVIRTGGPAVTEDVLESLWFPRVFSESESASSTSVIQLIHRARSADDLAQRASTQPRGPDVGPQPSRGEA
jgi:hypothetical protein